jgi:hypothetical protein
MLFIARIRRIDAQVTNFLNILTSAGKVSGVTTKAAFLGTSSTTSISH